MEILKNNKNTIIYLIFLVLFIICGYFVGINHESWADEAQHWLLARDCGILELINQRLKYEGHPLLWYLILKVFIFFKLPYEKFFIIPLIFSSIGVYILFFKIKFPMILKIFTPFTYYIFYQYSIISRSYCLIFPTLTLTAWFWKDRFYHPFRYLTCLILLFNICFYTQVLAVCLILYYFYEAIKREYFKTKTPEMILFFSIFAFFVLLNLYILHPASDFPFKAYCHFRSFEIEKVFNIFALSAFATKISLPITILSIFLYFVLPITFYKNFGNSFLYFYLMTIQLIVYTLFYYQDWHFGIIFLILMFTLWLGYESNFKTDKKGKIFLVILTMIIGIQINWTVISSIYDIKNPYCASKNVAGFLKENNYDKNKIYMLGYRPIAINPYFEKNLYQNSTQNKSFYIWQKIPNEKLKISNPEIFIVAKQRRFDDETFFEVVENDNYKKYNFKGNMVFKNNIRESNAFFVYVRKDLIK